MAVAPVLPPGQSPTPRVHAHRVLVVDDRPTTREILKLVLGRSGYRVTEAASGREALALIEAEPFDLVITDLLMPAMTGLELLTAIRKRFSRSELPVIILTVRDQDEDVVAAMRSGANDYVIKPLNHGILLARMETHLALRETVLALEREKAAAHQRDVDLEKANHDLDAFSFAVAHDLRAPLRGIRGFTQALRQDSRQHLDTATASYLDRILAASERMAGLVEDMDALARASRQEITATTVDLSALAGEVWTALLTRSGEPAPQCVIQPGLVVYADPQLLRLVIENLLDNAWKYTARAASPRVELAADDRAGRRIFRVSDHGVGFGPDDRGRVFRVFERVHDAQRFEGSGTGLAVVQRIIHRHHGEVWAEGRQGGGATVFFSFPAGPVVR